jgi:hypothetical protein
MFTCPCPAKDLRERGERRSEMEPSRKPIVFN